MGPVGRCRILRRMQWAHMTGGNTSQAMNGFGEIIPRNNAFIGEMIDAWHNAFFNDSHDRLCQIACIGGSTYLVEDNSQFGALFTQTNHRFHKVIAESAIQPCRTDNHRPFAMLHHLLFACQFRAAIDAIGTGLVSFHIRGMMSTVKHIVGRDMHHPSATFLYSSSQISRSMLVEHGTQFFVFLCLIHSGIACTIHDAVNFVGCNELFYCLLITYIQFLHIGIIPLILRVLALQQLHLIAQLAVTACYQYIHPTRILRVLVCLLNNSRSTSR